MFSCFKWPVRRLLVTRCVRSDQSDDPGSPWIRFTRIPPGVVFSRNSAAVRGRAHPHPHPPPPAQMRTESPWQRAPGGPIGAGLLISHSREQPWESMLVRLLCIMEPCLSFWIVLCWFFFHSFIISQFPPINLRCQGREEFLRLCDMGSPHSVGRTFRPPAAAALLVTLSQAPFVTTVKLAGPRSWTCCVLQGNCVLEWKGLASLA